MGCEIQVPIEIDMQNLNGAMTNTPEYIRLK